MEWSAFRFVETKTWTVYRNGHGVGKIFLTRGTKATFVTLYGVEHKTIRKARGFIVRSSNPVMNSLTTAKGGIQRGAYPAGAPQGYQDPYSGYGQTTTGDRPMTVDDVVAKTGMTLAVIVVLAVLNFSLGLVNPGLALMLTFVGAIGGLITVLVATFGKKYGSAAVTLIYAAFEGLFVGGISLLFSGVTFGESAADAGVLIGQAVMGTLGVFLGMLFFYKTGAVKVTPKFNRIMTGALVGVLVLALGNLLLAVFTGANPLRDGGMLAIIFSLVCIGLAAMSFLSDFDAADKMIRAGAPSKMAWGVALGLAVTLVWLYTEILRLLSYFRSN